MPSLGPRGDVLSQLRRALGYTQLELARRVGVSERTVRNAERGASIKHDFLEFIANGLGVSVADVVETATPSAASAATPWDQNAERLLSAIRRVIVEHDAAALLALADQQVTVRYDGRVLGLAFGHHMFKEFNGASGLSRFLVACRQFWQACGDVDYYVEFAAGGENIVVLRCGHEYPLRSGGYGWTRAVAICEFVQDRLARIEVFLAPGNGPPEVGAMEREPPLYASRTRRLSTRQHSGPAPF